MARQFYHIKLATLDETLAINVSAIKAILPLEDDKYRIWLFSDFEISSEAGNRLSTLGGVLPISKDCWDVHSSDLAEVFK